MALTGIQRTVCRLLAQRRVAAGDSYVAGGAALNLCLGTARVSRDIDVFHDEIDAVSASWLADRESLNDAGYAVHTVHERPSFVEATVTSPDGEAVVVQWAADSAYRFFPLVSHSDLGLTLHPVDLATNKVLALVGRVEARDWVDTLSCCRGIQPLGYLVWAASGKDPGLSPELILEQAARSTRYTTAELAALQYDGPAPEPTSLSREWRGMLAEARVVVASLPADTVGRCVLSAAGELLRLPADDLAEALSNHEVVFHQATLCGAFPSVRPR